MLDLTRSKEGVRTLLQIQTITRPSPAEGHPPTPYTPFILGWEVGLAGLVVAPACSAASVASVAVAGYLRPTAPQNRRWSRSTAVENDAGTRQYAGTPRARARSRERPAVVRQERTPPPHSGENLPLRE